MLDIDHFHRTIRRLKKFNPKKADIIKSEIFKGVEIQYPYDMEGHFKNLGTFREDWDTKRTFIVNADENGKAFIVGSCNDPDCSNVLDYEERLEDVTVTEIADYISDLISEFKDSKIVILRNSTGNAVLNELLNLGFRDYLFKTYQASTDKGDEIVTYGINYDIGTFVESMEELGKWVIEQLESSTIFFSNMIPYEFLSINLKEVTASKKMEQISTKDYSDNLVVQTWAVAMLFHIREYGVFTTPTFKK